MPNLLSKRFIIFSAINYGQSAISFGSSLLLARHMEVSDYGVITLGIALSNIVFVLMQFGTDKTLVRDLVQQKEIRAELLVQSIFTWFLLGLLCVAGSYLYSIGDGYGMILLLLIFSGFIRGLSPIAWYDVTKRMNLQSVFVLIDRSLYISAILAMIFVDQVLLLNIALALVLSRVVSFLLEWGFLFRKYGRELRSVISAKNFIPSKSFFSSNVLVWGAGIGNLMMTQFNQVLLESRSSLKEMAYYGIAFQIVIFVKLFQKQILRYLAPQLASRILNRVAIKKMNGELLRVLLYSSLITIPLFIFSPYIISNLLGERYIPAQSTLNVLLIWITLYGVGLIINQYLLNLRKEKSFIYVTLIYGLMSLVIGYFLIGIYGALGAALTLLIAHFLSIITQYILVSSNMKAT